MSETQPKGRRRGAELVEAFLAVRSLDARFWVPNIVYLIDGAAYFGILHILTLHLGTTVGLGDVWAGRLVAYLTGMLTLFMALCGGWVDRLGVRKMITLTIVASLAGRVMLVAAPSLGGSGAWASLAIAFVGLTLMAFGAGLLMTATYAAVKQSTDERTSALGFSLVYALMNLGIVLESGVSSPVRARWNTTGVLVMCTALTVVYLVVHLALFPKKAPPAPTGPSPLAAGESPRGWRHHPLADPRFLFFIFVLLGVRTLFAHQWLTMPDYVVRCYEPSVGAKYEWINGLNPLIVLIGTPLVAGLTSRVPVLTMMLVGTTVSALSTFLLVPGPNLAALLTYVVVFSIGEALWNSRFLEYVSAIAPPERIGVYMGVANLPWFLAKFTTGLYSGAMLQAFVPKEGPKDSSTMWLLYAAIALTSPVGIALGRRWLNGGTRTAAAAA